MTLCDKNFVICFYHQVQLKNVEVLLLQRASHDMLTYSGDKGSACIGVERLFCYFEQIQSLFCRSISKS